MIVAIVCIIVALILIAFCAWVLCAMAADADTDMARAFDARRHPEDGA